MKQNQAPGLWKQLVELRKRFSDRVAAEFDAIAEDRDKTLDLTPDRNSCDPQQLSEDVRKSRPSHQLQDIDSRGRNFPV
jgi:hypothetical protein